MSEYECGVRTPRMKGPCAKWHRHLDYDPDHASRSPENEDTPRMRQFAGIVHAGLDHGVQLSYPEIAELMGHPNVRSVVNYGLGGRYTRLRQKIYRERGIEPDNHRRSAEQSIRVVQSMKEVL